MTGMTDYCDGYLAKIASGRQGAERARLAKFEQDRRASRFAEVPSAERLAEMREARAAAVEFANEFGKEFA